MHTYRYIIITYCHDYRSRWQGRDGAWGRSRHGHMWSPPSPISGYMSTPSPSPSEVAIQERLFQPADVEPEVIQDGGVPCENNPSLSSPEGEFDALATRAVTCAETHHTAEAEQPHTVVFERNPRGEAEADHDERASEEGVQRPSAAAGAASDYTVAVVFFGTDAAHEDVLALWAEWNELQSALKNERRKRMRAEAAIERTNKRRRCCLIQ